MGIDYLLLTGAILLLISILIAKSLDNIGIPTLLLFIGIGILAGSKGIGGIYFDGLSVLSQIAMFLTLGLLVFPSCLLDVIWPGLLIRFRNSGLWKPRPKTCWSA
jgi:cell volume regulation protein A